MTTLIISEKPSLGKTIADALLSNKKADKLHIAGILPDGSKCIVTWARGHLLTLAEPKAHDPKLEKWEMSHLPFLPQKFIDTPIIEKKNPKYQNSATAQQVLEHIVKLLKQIPADCEVINGCDAGREGDLIFMKILKHAGVKPSVTSRLWIQSTLKEAILDAYNTRKPIKNYAGLTQSAYTRDRSDWLWGLNLTRMTTLRLGARRQVLPVGRVQTPTLAMIVKRERIRKSFVPANYYTLVAKFPSGLGDIDINSLWKDNKEEMFGKGPDYAEDTKAWWDKGKCEAFAKYAKSLGNYNVTDSEKIETQRPPMPFDLPSLQTDCNKVFGWTAANTLKLLQHLYDQGYVTYPRTDCKYFPEDMIGNIYSTAQNVMSSISELSKQKPVLRPNKAPACFNSARVTDHFAIIPTGKVQGLENLSDSDPNLYKLFVHITKRMLQALDLPAEYKVTTRVWQALKDSNVKFIQTSKAAISLGWKRWLEKERQPDEPLLPRNSNLEAPQQVSIVSHVTKCPPAFSEGALISAMEAVGRNLDCDLLQDMTEAQAAKLLKNKGIGTAATRHEVIEKLLYSKYIVREKKNLVPTELGMNLINNLEGLDPLIVAPEQTAIWEQKLVEMENGNGIFQDFIRELYKELCRIREMFDKCIPQMEHTPKSSLQESDTICPISGKPMLIGEKFYISPAFPRICLWKNLAGKVMTLYDWVRILEANSKRQRFVMHGFEGKYGSYAANVVLDTDQNKAVVLPVKEKR